MSMNIAIGYNNAFGVKASLNNIASVMEAYHQMDELIKSGRVMIEYGTDGEPSAIRACIIATTSTGKRLVYQANPANYTLSITQATVIDCSAHVYEVMIKTGRRTLDKKTTDSMHAATLYVHGLHAGYPVFMRRDGEIVAVDNCGPKWASYSIHASADQPAHTPAAKAGVVSMPDPEPEYIPETDLDATLDEMNDAIGYDDFVSTVADDSFI